MSPDPSDYTMTSGQVADRIGVNHSTIVRWARDRKIPSVTTLGGHRRYRPADVEALVRRMERGERFGPAEGERED